MVTRNRPENSRGGQSCVLCGSKNVGRLDNIRKPVPGDILKLTGMELHVVGHAMLVGIYARRHGNVTGICKRRINGFNLLYPGAAIKNSFKVGQILNILHILANPGINRKYKQTTVFFHFLFYPYLLIIIFAVIF
jgi:hypothetical protein